MQDLLGKLSGNFVVSAFIPSLAFMAVAMLIFSPIIPPVVRERLVNTFTPFDEEWVLVLVLTAVLAFALWNLNTFLYKVFEGYFLLVRLPWVRARQRRKAERYEAQLIQVERKIQQLECLNPQDPILQDLEDERYYIASELDLRYPPSGRAVLPTGFGNILRAAETYSATRYGIDAVRAWPRLIHVMPESYYEKVEQSTNGLSFLINCSVLSLLLALSAAGAAGYQQLMRHLAALQKPELVYFVPVNSALVNVYSQRVILYAIMAGAMLILSWLFYRASFPIAVRYGNLVRASFDLFRFDLLQQLRLPLPEDSEDEYQAWRMVSELMAVGDRFGALKFEYEVRPETTK